MSADPIIDEIKHKLDIVEIVGHYLTLKKSGTNFKAPCPFHSEKTPSFMVNRERQLYRCFGCGEAGDVFAFVMKQENIDFANALQLLAAKAGVTLPERSARAEGQGGENKATLVAVNDAAAKFFHQVITSHAAGKEALAYIKKRGVNEASLSLFQLGYAPQQSQAIQDFLVKSKFNSDVVRQAGNPDRFRSRIMFPFRDVIGQVIGFSGRALGDVQPKYLNTSETRLFHKNRYLYGLYEAKKAIAKEEKIILVEGQLDLVLAHQSGTAHTVATSGTALTDDHFTVMRRYSDNLLLAFDADEAGRKATERAIKMAVTHEFDVKVVALPEGSDPGELAANDSAGWIKAVQHPVEAIDWLFTYYFKTDQKLSASERTKAYDALFPYIAAQKDSVGRSYMIQRLALLLGLSQDKVIHEAFAQWKEKQGQQSSGDVKSEPATAPEPPLSEIKRREQHLIGLLLVQPDLLAYKEFYLQDGDFAHESLRNIYKSIISWYTETTIKSSDQLIRSVESMLQPQAKAPFQKLVFDIQTEVSDFTSEQLLREYTLTVGLIRQRLRENRIQSFAQRIAQAEASGDRAQVVQLIAEMQAQLKK